MANRDINSFVPGVSDLINGEYTQPNGKPAISAIEKIARGKLAIQSLSNYRQAKTVNDTLSAGAYQKTLEENFSYFGYGYLSTPGDLVPPVGLVFYSFHIMVILGGFFILLFIVTLFFEKKEKFANAKWLQYVCLWSIPFAYITSQAGWIVAEVGRQPWAIQDILPTNASISNLSTSSVQTTFVIFLVLFTVLLIAEIGIMVKAIKKGPETSTNNPE